MYGSGDNVVSNRINAAGITYFNGGNVGIGTTTPGKKLEINGDILLSNATGSKQIFTWSAADTNWRIGMNQNPGFTRSMTTSHVQYLTYSSALNQGFAIGVNNGNSSMEVRGSDHTVFFRGNVGLGTTTPDEKLAVNGNIHAKEVRVDLIGWPDFVFEKDYDLPTLQEVETQIREKGHLENIPSAKEVEVDGIKLGEMNAKLLQKIEELTLYTIEQEKEIDLLKTQYEFILDQLKKDKKD